MNYIEQIKYFWLQDKIYSLNGFETRLYFYLLETANCLHWELIFWQRDIQIMGNVGISKNTLNSCRNRLKQAQLINFESGGKGYGNKTRYQILTPKNNLGTQILTPNPIPKVIPKVSPLIKQKQKQSNIKNEQKRFCSVGVPNLNFSFCDLKLGKISIPPKPPRGERKKVAQKKEFSEMDFVSPEFREAFAEWLRFKADRRESYKSEKSAKMCYDKLVKLSGGKPDVAMLVVEQSMANNWAGIFELAKEFKKAESRINITMSPPKVRNYDE